MTLKVLTPGPLSLIQDLGRYGYQPVGVSHGGPMDEFAFLWANRLLGNDNNSVQIEIAMGQFSAQFQQDTIFALTGADMAAKLNEQDIQPWQSYRVLAGDRLSLRGARSGLRAYLAVKDGFQCESILGSCSTVVRDELGGLTTKGDKLVANTLIPYPKIISDELAKQVPAEFIPTYSKHICLEVIPCYQYDQFSPSQRELFFSMEYELTPQMDRMGCRLSGTPVTFPKANLISEGIVLGAIQIPADGQPIILMRDRQTIGGYPKIGCITHKSLSLLAQSLPGTKIRFAIKDRQEAEKERKLQIDFFDGFVSKFKNENILIGENHESK